MKAEVIMMRGGAGVSRLPDRWWLHDKETCDARGGAWLQAGFKGPYCSTQWLPASCSATRDGAVAPSHSSPGSVVRNLRYINKAKLNYPTGF
jgi:hypothetical protein